MASNYMRGEILNVKIKLYTKKEGIQVFIDDIAFFVPTNVFHLAKLSNVKAIGRKIEKYKKAPQQSMKNEKLEVVKFSTDYIFGAGSFMKLYKKYKSVDIVDFIVSTAMDQLAIEIEKEGENGRRKNCH